MSAVLAIDFATDYGANGAWALGLVRIERGQNPGVPQPRPSPPPPPPLAPPPSLPPANLNEKIEDDQLRGEGAAQGMLLVVFILAMFTLILATFIVPALSFWLGG